MYVKYLLGLHKICFYLLSHIFEILHFCTCWLRSKLDPFVKIFLFLNRELGSVPLRIAELLLVYIAQLIFIAIPLYTCLKVWYYLIMFPFFILTFPLKFFIFGFNFTSFSIVEKVLLSFYACFFPQIKRLVLNKDGTWEDIVNSFEIKPKQIMFTVPFLVQRRKTFWGDYLWICIVMAVLITNYYPILIISLFF